MRIKGLLQTSGQMFLALPLCGEYEFHGFWSLSFFPIQQTLSLTAGCSSRTRKKKLRLTLMVLRFPLITLFHSNLFCRLLFYELLWRELYLHCCINCQHATTRFRLYFSTLTLHRFLSTFSTFWEVQEYTFPAKEPLRSNIFKVTQRFLCLFSHSLTLSLSLFLHQSTSRKCSILGFQNPNQNQNRTKLPC